MYQQKVERPRSSYSIMSVTESSSSSSAHKQRPLIGISLDIESNNPSYSQHPWYALRQNYSHALVQAGATTLALPHDTTAVDQYLDILSGIVITGGAFDVDPQLYGAQPRQGLLRLKPERTAFEMALLQGALDRKMPLLGICGGEQLLAVVLGGTLVQHIPDEIPKALEHLQDYDAARTSHAIQIVEGTLLHRLTQTPEMPVNSRHHQAVKDVPEPLTISATAPDGVVEAIELPTSVHPFCLGVQWHPEFQATGYDTKILQGFVAATREYSERASIR
jgi:putative glutamine amidotransferase